MEEKMKTSTLFPLILFLLFSFHEKNNGYIAVIVNRNNPVNNLTLEELRKIYLGKITEFPNGERVILGEFSSGKKKFYEVLLGMSPHKVKKHWISVVFSGGNASPPVELKNLKEVKEFVSKYPGAICFINVKKVDKDLKVLRIDGKKPGDRDYPLR
jgi:phosphate transport system substrate-binding protein